MQSNPYFLAFTSQNDEDEKFELSFEVLPSRKMPAICNVQVYQRRGDTFCEVTLHAADKRTCIHVKSIHNSMQFSIEIFAALQSCEIFIIERVLTTIVHKTIQPQSNEN